MTSLLQEQLEQKEVISIIIDPFILPAFADKRKYTKIRAGRRTGKTYGAVQWICICLLKNPGSLGLWVDTVQLNIDKYVKRYFKPILGKSWDSVNYNSDKKTITFGNGSILDFGSAERPELLEGFEYNFGVLNEAGIILKKEGLWLNTLQPMFKNARVKIIGTPKGKTGKDGNKQMFAQMSDWAKIDTEEWAEYHYTGYDSPFWQREQLDKIQQTVPSYIWLQEYIAEHVDVYENSMIGMESLRFWHQPLDLSQFTKVFIHADTTHTGKTSSDYFACGVMGEGRDKNYYLLDYVLEKLDEEKQARAAIGLYQKWIGKVQKMTFDEKAHQGFGYWIKKLAREEYNISLPIEELNYPNDKITHFTPHVPHFKSGRVYLPAIHPAGGILQDQILAFPSKEVKDDAVDMISGLLDNFNYAQNLLFSTNLVSMQPIKTLLVSSEGWNFYGTKKPGRRYVIGGYVGLDCSYYVVDCVTKEVIAEYYNPNSDTLKDGKEITEKGYIYNNAMVGINNSGFGSSIIKILKEKNYPNIYENMTEKSFSEDYSDTLGYSLNKVNKHHLLTQLAMGISYFTILISSSILKDDILRYPRENVENLNDAYSRVIALAFAYDMMSKIGTQSKITIS